MADRRKDKSGKVLRKGESQRKDGTYMYRWANNDGERECIYQIQYRMLNGTTQLYATDTKTSAGRRTIPMTDEVYQLFIEQKKVWLNTKKDPDFEVDRYKNFVFVSHMTGKCMNHNSVRRRMRTIVDMNDKREVRLPDLSPHILRHTACCRYAESGCDIKVLQYLMGQTDIKTTMRVYNHVDMERVKRELNRLKEWDLQSKSLHQNLHHFADNLCGNM